MEITGRHLLNAKCRMKNAKLLVVEDVDPYKGMQNAKFNCRALIQPSVDDIHTPRDDMHFVMIYNFCEID